MIIAVAQTHLTIGDIENNFQHIKKQVEPAISAGAELVIFPEQSLTVKGANDLLKIPQYIKSAEQIPQKLLPFSNKITILIGGLEGGYLIQNGKIELIPTNKFVLKNGHITTAETPEATDYTIQLRSVSFTKNKEFKKEKNTIYINHVGLCNENIYEGCSYVTDKNGEIAVIAKKFEEDLLIFDTNNLSKIEIPKTCKEENIFNALSFGFKEFCRINNFTKGVIGLSGGIDSALTAVIMCEALGAENVLGITMPSKYSTEGSIKDSYDLAKNLGMECLTKPIKPLFDTFINEIQGKSYGDLAEENLQARLRGNILMAYSNRENRVLVSTGNKSECSMGYCTLYGDTCGGINLICDLYKQEVYALSRWINREKEIIPQNTITKAPSAELRPNQKDQDTLPDYAILDEILYRYTEMGENIEKIGADFGVDFVREIINKLNRMEFKRNQFTFGLKISEKALSDRKYPLTNIFRL